MRKILRIFSCVHVGVCLGAHGPDCGRVYVASGNQMPSISSGFSQLFVEFTHRFCVVMVLTLAPKVAAIREQNPFTAVRDVVVDDRRPDS
jgi:hypothetical protein